MEQPPDSRGSPGQGTFLESDAATLALHSAGECGLLKVSSPHCLKDSPQQHNIAAQIGAREITDTGPFLRVRSGKGAECGVLPIQPSSCADLAQQHRSHVGSQ